jgi:NADH:ubiquinone oxidoreductase subunit K
MYSQDFALILFSSFYFLALIIFFIGLFSMTLAHRSLILILIGLELILLSLTFLFILQSKITGILTSQLALLIFLVLGGTESSIGLALIMLYYYQKKTILITKINDLKH